MLAHLALEPACKAACCLAGLGQVYSRQRFSSLVSGGISRRQWQTRPSPLDSEVDLGDLCG